MRSSLHYIGCRPAELIEIPPAWIDLSAGTVTIRSLKKRPDKNGAPKIVYRAVPVPAEKLFGQRKMQWVKGFSIHVNGHRLGLQCWV